MMMETLGARVKSLREKKKFTAARLGAIAGIGENALYKIESGSTNEPSFRVGVRLAKALGVEPFFLAFGESSRATQPVPSADASVTHLIHAELRALRMAQAEGVRQFLELQQEVQMIQERQVTRTLARSAKA